MKVYIGPYRNWVGPYQIADALLFWSKNDDLKWDFGEWLDKTKDGKPSKLNRFCNWLHQKTNRKVKIRIDRYDTWNMDHTLSLIILPMLKQLKETQHGSGFVDDADVPDHIKSTSARPKENEWDSDEFFFMRWDYVIDEMIFAFEIKADKDGWDTKIYERHGNDWPPEALAERKAIVDRMDNGFRLFGKYFQNLWD